MGNSQVREGRCPKSIDDEDWLIPFYPILSQRLIELSNLLFHDLHGFSRLGQVHDQDPHRRSFRP
jgi:hypothetical protein